MMELFTDRARRVMTLAEKEARRLGREKVGTEDLLFGLAEEGSGVAAHVLKNMDVSLDKIREQVRAFAQPLPGPPPERKLPLADKVRESIRLAHEEMHALGHTYVGTEHLLLGLLREGNSVACGVLRGLGVDLESLREETRLLLGAAGQADTSPAWAAKKVITFTSSPALGYVACTLQGLLDALDTAVSRAKPDQLGVDVAERLEVLAGDVRAKLGERRADP